jgi:hypothetical protein
MTGKTDLIITMLDEILMRLDRIERLVDFCPDEDGPEDIQETFDKIFGKTVDKPMLSVVKSDTDNVIELKIDD